MPRPTTKSLKNLLDRSAIDKPGETVTLTVRVKPGVLKWLNSLEGGRGYHLRQALDIYKKRIDNEREASSND